MPLSEQEVIQAKNIAIEKYGLKELKKLKFSDDNSFWALLGLMHLLQKSELEKLGSYFYGTFLNGQQGFMVESKPISFEWHANEKQWHQPADKNLVIQAEQGAAALGKEG